jgi:hypothetical protein
MNKDKLTWIDAKITPVPEDHQGLVLTHGSRPYLLDMLSRLGDSYGIYYLDEITHEECFSEIFDIDDVTHWLPELPLPNKEGV